MPKKCLINEQVVRDAATGVAVRFEVRETGETVVHVCGDFIDSASIRFHFDPQGAVASRMVHARTGRTSLR